MGEEGTQRTREPRLKNRSCPKTLTKGQKYALDQSADQKRKTKPILDESVRRPHFGVYLEKRPKKRP